MVPLFTDVKVVSGRHALLFVNQQYDWEMMVCWNAALGDYAFDVSHDEARRIAKSWGWEDFDVEKHLAEARVLLPKRDAEKK